MSTSSRASRSRLAALFAAALALRAGCALCVSLLSGVPLEDLALFFDGHLYILIARSLPRLYAGAGAAFPAFPKDAAFLTAWFPAYPALIRALALFVDWRWAALLACWVPASLAVALFHELARDYTPRPLPAALLFAFLPPAWLLGGSLAFVEGLYACLLLGCVLALRRGRVPLACALGAAFALTQKSGFLLAPILLLGFGRRSLPVLAAAAAAGAALQLYLWRAFGDPLINLETHRRIFGGAYFGLPFAGIAQGLLSSESPFAGLFAARKAYIALETLFYAGAFAWALRRPKADERPLLAWLGCALLFYSCLTGAAGFYAFPRFMTVAAAPALLLAWRRLPPLSARWAPAAALALAACLSWNAADSLSALDLASRYWGPGYYRAFVASLRAP